MMLGERGIRKIKNWGGTQVLYMHNVLTVGTRRVEAVELSSGSGEPWVSFTFGIRKLDASE